MVDISLIVADTGNEENDGVIIYDVGQYEAAFQNAMTKAGFFLARTVNADLYHLTTPS